MKIPVVNENDEVIEIKDRKDVDKSPELIYRVSYLWVTDTNGRILLAQRAFNKNHNPGKWGPAVAGTVEEGETYESNIIKETEEEIGIKDVKLKIGQKERRKTNYNYFAQEFLLELPAGFNDFKIQEVEVAQIKWFTKEELKKELQEHPDNFLSLIKNKIDLI
ncbi:MAG TPA: NUDIX domain-containing protein [Candidatus Paceibacterota bacterium]|nr:NUDIX domain-containing protein [Candidatus Paceibacterota bacterium]HPT18202.1 NUDIX domain-containing protein [Candidatus Paceibacterota bacterium]